MAGKKEKIARVQCLLEYVVSDLLSWSESGHICNIVFSVVFHKASSVNTRMGWPRSTSRCARHRFARSSRPVSGSRNQSGLYNAWFEPRFEFDGSEFE